MARGKPEIEREKCNGCGRCIEVCPQNILEIEKIGRRRFAHCIDEEICIACSECSKVCPKHAVRIWSFSITAGG